MRKLRLAFACAIAAASAAVGCELVAGLQDRSLCQNGCADVAEAAPFEATTNPDFTLAISPANIIVEPSGPGIPVAITLTRIGGFSEAVAISLANVPSGVSGSAIIPGNASTGTLNVFADQTAVVGQVNSVTVAAQSTPSGILATQPLTIRVGHVLLAAKGSTTFVVPSDVQNATIAAWGAGGGGGGTTTNGNEQGGAGGAGGFAEGTFAVTPGETLRVIVAAPGAGGNNSSAVGFGGGGGGYSAVLRDLGDGGVDASAGDAGSPYLIVAGGGGGGGGGFYYATTTAYSGPGKAGGAGSGANGANGLNNTGGGKGGTTTAGGAGGTSCGVSGAGGFLQGGNAGIGRSDGGLPGGGYGNSTAGGGGGGGYYGGGSGGGYAIGTCLGGNGGGGGAGQVDATGTNATTTAGTGATAPSTNHKYYLSGVAMGGGAATAGGPGHVVIYAP